MKAFVTGATGYIGFNVAKALRRAGYEVYGLTRSKKKATMLAQNEILPVIGDMQQPDSYRDAIDACSLLVHAAVDYEHDTVDLDKKTVTNLIASGKRGSRPKTFIYTSGCWVIGDTGDKMADETTPLNPIDQVRWRPDVERLVLDAEEINGLVVRPGCVYGERGGLTAMWFDAAEKGNLSVVGDGSNCWTMVHVDDLADAYVRLADSGFYGETFNISDRSRWSVREMAEAVADVSGYDREIQYIPVQKAEKDMGGMAEALALNQHVDGRKAAVRLGWQPRHGGFVDNIKTFYASWKAWKQ